MKKNDNIAVADINKCLTYTELEDQINITIKKIQKYGIQPFDVVMLRAESKVEFVYCYLALHRIKAICIPFSSKANEIYINKLAWLSGTRYCISDVEKCAIINMESGRSKKVKNEKNIYDILYTSGTTSQGKGVILSEKAVGQSINNIVAALDLKKEDFVLLPLPLHHSHGLGTLRAALKRRSSVILSNGIIDIEPLMQKYPCTILSCSPTMIEWIIRRYNVKCQSIFHSIRCIEIGTAPLVGNSRKRVKEIFQNKKILISYGATEAPRAIYMDLTNNSKEYAIGKPVGDYIVQIFRSNSNCICPKNEVGMLGVYSKALMDGYLNVDIPKEKIWRGKFFLTGDIGYVDDDNDVILVGRNSDLIIIGGEKVYASEIEQLVNEIQGVNECICIGVKTENLLLQEKIIAFVKEENNYSLTEKDIKLQLKGKIENYKVPSEVLFIDNFPRNEMGKIDKARLKEFYGQRKVIV